LQILAHLDLRAAAVAPQQDRHQPIAIRDRREGSALVLANTHDVAFGVVVVESQAVGTLLLAALGLREPAGTVFGVARLLLAAHRACPRGDSGDVAAAQAGSLRGCAVSAAAARPLLVGVVTIPTGEIPAVVAG